MSELMTMTAARSAAKKDCGCGCSGSGGDCCELECLVHPRFFCGQLLADQDLTALVDWVKAKGALARYRHGWGVVCGLDVHCGSRGTITVSPGYAMDCCGRDIVVCDETKFDLAQCWKRPEDPCGNGAAQPAMAALKLSNGQPSTTNNGQFNFIPPEELQAVDILIRYSESQSDSRSALARGGCGGAAGCEYTRVHEGSEIYCRPADGCEVADDPWIEWETEYVEGLRKLRADLDRLVQTPKFDTTVDRRAAIDRFIAYVTRHSPHSFCFISEWLCYLQGTQVEIDPKDDQKQKAAATELRAAFAQVAFWIVQDWRNEYLLKPCRGCGPETGIHLARVWIWMRRDNRGKETLSTVYVNAYPPFRRALSDDEWQLPADKINLGSHVWTPVETALPMLRRTGISPVLQHIDATISAFAGNEVLLADAGTDTPEPLTMYWTFDPHCPDQRRVVAFVRRGATAPAGTTPTGTPQDVTPIVVGEPVDNPITPATPSPRPHLTELTQLKGIGDGIANRLQKGGINTVADLAAAETEAVKRALSALRITDARIEEMIKQARAANVA